MEKKSKIIDNHKKRIKNSTEKVNDTFPVVVLCWWWNKYSFSHQYSFSHLFL